MIPSWNVFFAGRLSFGLILILGMIGAPSLQALTVVGMQCEGRESARGVDSPEPRLSWNLQPATSTERDIRQASYHILVASTQEQLDRGEGDLWDSGKVASDAMSQIPYGGKKMSSSQKAFWKVRVEGRDGTESDWSAPANWTMGVLKPEDWQAKWIGATDGQVATPILLRREFKVRLGLKRAVIHVTGLGQYEMFLNGAKVSNNLLSPGWTNYQKTILYDTFEIGSQLQEGANAMGISLGNGMYNVTGGRYTKFKGTYGPLQVIAQLRLEYADGSTEIMGTDETWSFFPSPVTFSCVYGGEDYDARLEQKGWSQAGFTKESWIPARTTAGPGGGLRGLSCSAPPIRTFDVLKPVNSKELNKNTRIYDMGQNASLMPRLSVRGPAGSSVRIIPSELLKNDRDIDDTMCRGMNWWQYTLKGGGEETFFPQFYYRGARYLKVELRSDLENGPLPEISLLEGVVVHSASRSVGEFSCSNELFNRTYHLVRWAQRSNLVSLITDCPTREKLGWLEQYHLNGPALRYNFNLDALYSKGVQDMEDSQQANGFIPSIAPEYVKFGGDGDSNPFRNSVEWGSALVLSPWQQYEFGGDLALLARSYESMKRYIAYLEGKAQNHILDFGLGDWYDIGPKPPGASQLTPRGLTATAIYYEDLTVMAQVAVLQGKEEDARLYQGRALAVREAFNARYFNRETRQYATGSQCANAMPLVLGLVDEKYRPALLANLVKDVEEKGLTAGDVGYRYLLRALADGGRSDVIYSMNNQSGKPGYGMQLAQGATSLTEAWDARRSSSQNHFMLGQINEWFFHDLAGIQPDPAGPGFKKIVIRPSIVGDLTQVKASYDSVMGTIKSGWSLEGGRLEMAVTIPANTEATLYVPVKESSIVSEQGKALDEARGIHVLRKEKSFWVLAAGSGVYRFTVSEFQP